MAWWASGNARQPEGPQTREGHRLDRRVLGTSRAGVGPAPQGGNLRARSLVLFGSGAGVGLFEYSGTPGPGNQPVAYAAPPGVLTDPFGNTLPSSGGGFTASDGVTIAFLTGSTLAWKNISTPPSADPQLLGGPASASGCEISLVSGRGTAGASGVTASLIDSLQSATATAQLLVVPGIVGGTPATKALVEVQGSQALKGIATPASPAAANALLFADTNGFERMLPGLAGDTNAYQIGEVTLTSGGFTINSASPQTIMSCPVGIGTYVVDVWMVTANTTAANAAGYAFSGPTAGVQLVAFESKTTGTAVVGYGSSATYTTQFNGQNFNGNQDVLMRALVAFSAAGTLAITGKELAGTTIAVFGGWMRVRHVS